ncbi:efflux RND transporter periplasmic adaptor subunit [Fictibacillus nanhaiensis]|uniref:efflux RND transporter periplasmic adaptor subunit n=1 Tax=Fictibacillus nanhaiensis TaxID=742169 RepID=UPI001C948B15|nr:efflux RND transporter periplasmic adaptor subunit [Fictibacillus nanhaiensis]MBY6036392.1 efflux RND transporter periplasmic adaptor subunit [Fictibacillus nanhaiensis]
MNKWKWTAAALMMILLLVMNLLIFDKKESSAIEAPRLKTVISKEHDFIKKWDVTGTAQSKNTFHIYYDPSRGTIREIAVSKGETVTSGQTLLTYENAEIEKELRELNREKEAADVRADHYSSQISEWEREISSFDEKKDNADAKVMLQQQLAEAELQKSLAENESSVLTDGITELTKQVEDLSVKSPADGVVSEVNETHGDEPILTIVGQGNFELKAIIDQNVARVVKTGKSVQIQSPNNKKKLKGTVQTVLPTDKDQTFSMTVLVEEEADWVEGQPATIIISETLAENAVSIPEKSVFTDNGSQYVWILVKEKVYKIKVKTGLRQGGVVEINKGLKKGQVVVLNPSPVFVSGQPALTK